MFLVPPADAFTERGIGATESAFLRLQKVVCRSGGLGIGQEALDLFILGLDDGVLPLEVGKEARIEDFSLGLWVLSVLLHRF